MDGYVTIGTELDSSMIDKQIALLENKLEGLVEEYEILEKAEPFEGQSKELIKLANEIDTTRKKLAKLNQQSTTDFSGIKKSIDGVGNSVQKVTRKVGKWALALFGIREVYGFIRNSINTIASDDDQLSADIEYMKSALAYTIEPVVRAIIDLVKQLMFYVAYIVKAWTGVNIFENANKGLAKANKQAKELQKTTASFDEMNVVGGETSSGGTGITTPSFDLTKPEDYPIPSWLQWILDHKDELIAGLAGIAGAILLIYLGVSGLKALGIGTALAGIVYTIEKLLDYLDDPTWENFGGIIQGIGLAVLGIGIAFGNLPAIIAGVMILIVGTVIKYWDKINEKIDEVKENISTFFDNIMNWFTENTRLLSMIFNGVIGTFQGVVYGILDFIQTVVGGYFQNLKQVFDGIIKIFKGDFKNGIVQVLKAMLNQVITLINSMISGINTLLSPFRAVITAGAKLLGAKNVKMEVVQIPKIPRLAKGGIINMPGKGVPVGSAIGGERGAEGVLPLTDSQQMDLLGQSIARHMVINLTNINQMNGRVISRELQRINNESDFAYNR